ncbi:DUF742 domain-containing protein [Streptomyces sp. NPDC051940]|uniref:DUF742 domain-containing protein n=1 Tax=Streptomyces sp. NPDC051940 TaxID=3155675 RepID=UPI00342A662B
MITPGDEEEQPTADFVRSYVIAGGHHVPPADELSLHTLITLAPDAELPRSASPEVRAIWELCGGGYLSVAEVAGHLGLPVGVVRVLLSSLLENRQLLRRGAPAKAEAVDRELIKEVLHGLQTRFG